MPCALAIAATDAPGTKHAAINSALMSAEYVRLLRRAVYLGVSESFSIVSTMSCCGHNIEGSSAYQQGDFAGCLRTTPYRVTIVVVSLETKNMGTAMKDI
jgi:hypothetical protein